MSISKSEVSKLSKLREYRVSLDTLAAQATLQADQFGGGMPLNQLAVFFEVANAQALGSYATTTDIRLKLELDRRAVSRYLLSLGDQGYGGGKGMELVEFIADTTDRRTKRIALTRKGEELALRLAHQLRETAIKHLEHIEHLASQRFTDCLFMLGVDREAKLNVFVVRKPYCYGLYALMRQRMFSDITNYNTQHVDLVVLERRFSLTKDEIDQTLDNLKALRIAKGSPIVVWLASDENPKSTATKLNRRAKQKGYSEIISFHSTRASALKQVGLPTDWTYPELFPYD